MRPSADSLSPKSYAILKMALRCMSVMARFSPNSESRGLSPRPNERRGGWNDDAPRFCVAVPAGCVVLPFSGVSGSTVMVVLSTLSMDKPIRMTRTSFRVMEVLTFSALGAAGCARHVGDGHAATLGERDRATARDDDMVEQLDAEQVPAVGNFFSEFDVFG